MKRETLPSENIIKNVCKIKKGEKMLIIANPGTADIAQELYTAANDAGADSVLIFQNEKNSFDYAEKAVIAAIKSNPDVCFSLSSNKLGKDREACENPYKDADGKEYNHIFDWLVEGQKSMRAVWTPGITRDMFERTVNIDYEGLRAKCKKLSKLFENAEKAYVSAPKGTHITVPIQGRKLFYDDGNFSTPGTGGNIPAGEVFISPMPGSEGVIVFDGSMTFADGDSILQTPITCVVKDGFVSEISGGAEAKRLLKTITDAENSALSMETEKKLPSGMGAIYKKNARNIGELGIGLNPAAAISGNMLEDEKALGTCHFAIGENYDNDAPSLIHLDGLIRQPTIKLTYSDGSERLIMDSGVLKL